MKYRSIILLTFIFSMSLGAQDTLQSVIANAGDHFESNEIQVSWTLGEVAIETSATDDFTLSMGFHQGNLFVTGLLDDLSPDFFLKAYPNPVQDILIVESGEPGFDYQIMDLTGRIRKNGKISSTVEKLDFSSLPPGTYFIQVGRQSTHKIIKK